MVLVSKTNKPASIHHRKRNGEHHRKGAKVYTKSYWPYLPLLMVAGFGIVLNSIWPHVQPGGNVLAYATNTAPAALLQETNDQRQANGEPGLSTDAQLTSAAQAKANDMANRNYWSHVTPDGREPWWFVTNAGYNYQSTGENLAYGFDNSQATVTGWMNSPGHRANILNVDYQDVGFGIVNVENYQGQGPETIVVALYGKRANQPQTVASASKPSSVPPTVSATPVAATPTATPDATPAAVASAAPVAPAAGLPVAVTRNPQSGETLGVSLAASKPVARLQAFAKVPLSAVMTIIAIMALLAAAFIFRHSYFWHKALVKGERFMVKHWQLDLAMLAIITIGVLLTRTAGFIQ